MKQLACVVPCTTTLLSELVEEGEVAFVLGLCGGGIYGSHFAEELRGSGAAEGYPLSCHLSRWTKTKTRLSALFSKPIKKSPLFF